MCTTHADVINADLLAFIGEPQAAGTPFILAEPTTA
jgi:hypothetical protein